MRCSRRYIALACFEVAGLDRLGIIVMIWVYLSTNCVVTGAAVGEVASPFHRVDRRTAPST